MAQNFGQWSEANKEPGAVGQVCLDSWLRSESEEQGKSVWNRDWAHQLQWRGVKWQVDQKPRLLSGHLSSRKKTMRHRNAERAMATETVRLRQEATPFL